MIYLIIGNNCICVNGYNYLGIGYRVRRDSLLFNYE